MESKSVLITAHMFRLFFWGVGEPICPFEDNVSHKRRHKIMGWFLTRLNSDGTQKERNGSFVVRESFPRNSLTIQQMWRNWVQSHSEPPPLFLSQPITFLIGQCVFSSMQNVPPGFLAGFCGWNPSAWCPTHESACVLWACAEVSATLLCQTGTYAFAVQHQSRTTRPIGSWKRFCLLESPGTLGLSQVTPESQHNPIIFMHGIATFILPYI